VPLSGRFLACCVFFYIFFNALKIHLLVCVYSHIRTSRSTIRTSALCVKKRMMMAIFCRQCSTSDVDRVERFWDYSTTCRRRRDLLFQFRLQIFRRRVGSFSLFFLCCFYFLLKVHVNFSSVVYRDYRAVGTSSRHRPFFSHNFVFLLNCLFVLYRATRISVRVIAVSKSHKVLLKVRRLSSFFSTTTPTPSRRRVVFFCHDVGHYRHWH